MIETGSAATRLGAARLSSDELEVIETFLSRRSDLPGYMRMKTAGQLATRIRARLDLSSSSYSNDEELIEAIASEYRQR